MSGNILGLTKKQYPRKKVISEENREVRDRLYAEEVIKSFIPKGVKYESTLVRGV